VRLVTVEVYSWPIGISHERQAVKHTRFEGALLLIAFGIIAYQIFLPPVIGVADNWDFERLLGQNGLAHISTIQEEKYFLYFNSKYKIIPNFVPADPQDFHAFKSSTSLPIRVARRLSIIMGLDDVFDIRIQAGLYTLILLFGIWLILVSTRSLAVGTRIIICGLLILIFTDVGYISYFNSFYSEGTGLAFLVLAIGCSLALATEQRSRALLLLGYFFAIGMVITSKPQYFPLVLLLAPLGVYTSRNIGYIRGYWVAGSMALALFCVGAWYFAQAPQLMKLHIAYVEIFMDLLPRSDTPEQDLIDLGLDPNFAVFSGTTPYEPDSPLNDLRVRTELSTKVGSFTVPLFYLKHPVRLYQLCARCSKHCFSNRLRRFGYYEATTGKPPRAQPFGIWSIVRERAFPRSVFFLGLFFASGIGALFLARESSAKLRYIHLLYALFVFVAVLQFFIAVVVGGGRADLQKHLFMFNLAFDVCIILLVLGAVTALPHLRSFLISRWRVRPKTTVVAAVARTRL
jgi:hypothetical protein